MGHDDVVVTIVTPEPAPLALFGENASAAVSEELRAAGVQLKSGVVTRADRGGLLLEPGGERLDVQRVAPTPPSPPTDAAPPKHATADQRAPTPRGRGAQSRPSSIAMPCPPPMQSVTSPSL